MGSTHAFRENSNLQFIILMVSLNAGGEKGLPQLRRRHDMGKTVSCKDLGSLECTWKGRADTEEELIEMAKVHGRDAHGLTEISEELMRELKAAIRDE